MECSIENNEIEIYFRYNRKCYKDVITFEKSTSQNIIGQNFYYFNPSGF